MQWRRRTSARSATRPATRAATPPCTDAPPEDLLADPAPAALGGLLRALSNYRLMLDAGLTLAAAATESTDVKLAGDLVEEERLRLADTAGRLLGWLDDLEHLEHQRQIDAPSALPRPRRRLVVRSASLVGAAAVAFALLSGAVPPNLKPPALTLAGSDSVTASWASFSHLAEQDPTSSELVAAAGQLHHRLLPLIASAPGDRAACEKALAVLGKERALLETDHPAGSTQVLVQTRALLSYLNARISRLAGAALATPSSVGSQVEQTLHNIPGPLGGLPPMPNSAPTPSASRAPTPSASPTAITPLPLSSPSSPPPSKAPGRPAPPIVVPPLLPALGAGLIEVTHDVKGLLASG